MYRLRKICDRETLVVSIFIELVGEAKKEQYRVSTTEDRSTASLVCLELHTEGKTADQNTGHVKHPNDVSVCTYTGHAVLQTLIRCHFSPASTTGQRELCCPDTSLQALKA